MQARHRSSASARSGRLNTRRLSCAAILAATACVLLVTGARLHHTSPRSTADFDSTSEPWTTATRVPASARRTTAVVPSPPKPAVIGGIPVHVELPSLHTAAAVVPVSSTATELAVPDDPTTLGWWTASALPGASHGTTVIDGHVDNAVTGPGALYNLQSVHTGDPIAITLDDGNTLTYTVTARHTYTKTQRLPASLFTRTGTPTLELITCGGSFDPHARSYDSNIVVTARPGS